MITLPDLPYPYDALAPVVSAETMHLHHDKHHATYVKTTNELLAGSAGARRDLEDDRRRRPPLGEPEAVQQRRPGLEPRLLLDVHEPPNAEDRLASSRRRSIGASATWPA